MAYVVNYLKVANQVVGELLKRGDLKQTDNIEMAVRLDAYKEWLETYVVALLFEELKRWNGLEGFTELPEGNITLRNGYLARVIPDYEAFLRKSVNQAGNALLGESLHRGKTEVEAPRRSSVQGTSSMQPAPG